MENEDLLKFPEVKQVKSKTPKKVDQEPPKDVTAKFNDVLKGVPGAAAQPTTQPTMPVVNPLPNLKLNSFMRPQDVMKNAKNTQWYGMLPPEDTKGLVSRTIQITPHQDMMLSDLAQSDLFEYGGSKSHVARHAIELLLSWVEEQGWLSPDTAAKFGDFLRVGRMLREDAWREKTRAEYSEFIRTHDRNMETAKLSGDWKYVAGRLEVYEAALDACVDETQRQTLRSVFAESVMTHKAVIAFSKWMNDPGRAPNNRVPGWNDKWPELVEQWSNFYLEWGTT